MKIKVGGKIYDGDVEPIMVILTDKDKENITNMAPDAHKYAEFPDDMPAEDVVEFMRTDK